jgi:hypothetical protein
MKRHCNNGTVGDDGTTRRRQSKWKKAPEMSNNVSWAVCKFLFMLASFFVVANNLF